MLTLSRKNNNNKKNKIKMEKDGVGKAKETIPDYNISFYNDI